VVGIVAALREADVHADTATVLGAGGTAQAAIVALAELGVHECAVLVREPQRTAQLRATADGVHVAVEVARLDVTAPQLRAELVVATLPSGVADAFATAPWHSRQVILDVSYERWPTQLAAAATRAGADVRSGALLLLHQAAAQVELMTGRTAPVEVMRDALRAARPDAGL
jgi:shikimate dehydrogenase